ncbi:MAG: copper chaperone PCu(A)C [Cohaesibacter sp.]|nr:copper chaperone PCu(A)C [Cohaesibacter sp.]
MKKTLATALVASLMALSPAMAADIMAGDLTISGAFARASAGKAKAGGGFMMIKNKGDADRLLSASSNVAARTELHTHIMDGDVMRMREVKDGIPVPAKGEVALKPGSYHVMFMKLHEPLKKGQKFPVELTFEKAGKVTVEVEVGKVGAMMAPGMDHSKMDHSKMDHSKMKHGEMKKDGMKKAN